MEDSTPAAAVENLLDLRFWADATMLQIERVRHAWVQTCREAWLPEIWQDSQEGSEAYDALAHEVVDADIYFLILAAHQLLAARRRRLRSGLPRLSRQHEQAIEALRTVREHYARRQRDAFFGGEMTRPAAVLKSLDERSHPWGGHRERRSRARSGDGRGGASFAWTNSTPR